MAAVKRLQKVSFTVSLLLICYVICWSFCIVFF